MGFNWNKLNPKKWGKQAKQEIDKLDDEIKRELNNLKKQALKEVARARDGAIKDVTQAKRVMVREVQDTASHSIEKIDTLTKNLPNQIKEEVIDSFEELKRGGGKVIVQLAKQGVITAKKELESLRKSKPNLIKYIDNMAYTVKLGPVSLTYGNFYQRTDNIIIELDKILNNKAGLTRTTVRNFMEATGPDSTDLGIEINFAALVVSSESLGGGFALPAIELELVIELTDAILKLAGVPK